jgi:hypothetical protein
MKMSETIDDISMQYEEEGLVKVKELDKVILTRGAWCTIVFKYQDWNNTAQAYGPDKYSIRRYQKRNGRFMQQSKFNISNAEQARKVIAALETWID